MTLLRRSPRQVYRVYSEAEFLAAADWSGEAATEELAPDGAVREPVSANVRGRVAGVAARGPNPSAWGRVAGLAALTGALAAVAGVVVLSASRTTASRRGTLGPSADSRAPRSVAASAPATPPPSSQPLGSDRRRHGRAPRRPAAPRWSAQRRGVREVGQAGTPAIPASPAPAPLPASTSPAAPGTAPTPPRAPGPAPASQATASPAMLPSATTSPATASARAARAEFGFERHAG